MPVIALDLGGTKLALAVITAKGEMLLQREFLLNKSAAIFPAIREAIQVIKEEASILNIPIEAMGICIPGIYDEAKKTVWAPNIPGWENYPLYDEIKKLIGEAALVIESDRTCYIMGEHWQGAAKGCTDAIYLAIGTGIGAGILCDGKIIKGAKGIGGAVGWMVINTDEPATIPGNGFFESLASGEGIAALAKKNVQKESTYTGLLREKITTLTAQDVFAAYTANDVLARRVIEQSITAWGRGVANLISIFNPQKVILGGGVFGPAVQFIPAIIEEAKKWAQPISMQQIKIEASALGKNAGLLGAGWLAVQSTTV